MHKIREVLRLRHEAKLSHEKIHLAVGISKGAVAKYLSLSKAQGLTWPLPEELDDAALELRLFPVAEHPGQWEEPDFPTIHQELKRKGVTLQLLWSEYATAHGKRAYQYSRYCDLYRAWSGRQKRSMRQLHKAGEKLFIDYCGPTVEVIDHTTGEVPGTDLCRRPWGFQLYLRRGHLEPGFAGLDRLTPAGLALLRRRASPAGTGQSQKRHHQSLSLCA